MHSRRPHDADERTAGERGGRASTKRGCRAAARRVAVPGGCARVARGVRAVGVGSEERAVGALRLVPDRNVHVQLPERSVQRQALEVRN